MSTTTTRLPEDLESRVAEAAQREGMSTHAFMVQAIEQRAAQLEAHQDFVRTGLKRLAEWERTGESVSWEDARQYLLERAAGKKPARPRPRKAPGRRAA